MSNVLFACLYVFVLCMNGIEEQQEEGNTMFEGQTKETKRQLKSKVYMSCMLAHRSLFFFVCAFSHRLSGSASNRPITDDKHPILSTRPCMTLASVLSIPPNSFIQFCVAFILYACCFASCSIICALVLFFSLCL